jgi:hypothetical protein
MLLQQQEDQQRRVAWLQLHQVNLLALQRFSSRLIPSFHVSFMLTHACFHCRIDKVSSKALIDVQQLSWDCRRKGERCHTLCCQLCIIFVLLLVALSSLILLLFSLIVALISGFKSNLT